MATITGLFPNHQGVDRALEALEDAGFTRDALGVVAPEGVVEVEAIDDMDDDHVDAGEGATFGAAEGGIIGGLAGLLAGVGALAIPGVGPIVAAGSLATILASTLGGVAIGAGSGAVTGGLVGALIDAGVPEEHAHVYAEGIRRGSVLITVYADGYQAGLAKNILSQAGAIDVDEARHTRTEEGWPGVSAAVPPSGYQHQ